MLHHPPSWLSPTAQNMFCSEIFLPNRFDVCLYGHMHAGRATQVIMGGGAARFEYQSPSLCGLEHYGRSNADRALAFRWHRFPKMGRCGSGRINEFFWPEGKLRSSGTRVLVNSAPMES